MLPAARRVVAAALACGLPPARREDAELAVHEVVVNAVEHGHGGRSEPQVEIEVWCRDGAVEVRVVDAATAGDTARTRETSGEECGRGLLLAGLLADSITFDPGEAATVVTLRFATHDAS